MPLRRKLMHFFSVFFNATLFNMFKKRWIAINLIDIYSPRAKIAGRETRIFCRPLVCSQIQAHVSTGLRFNAWLDLRHQGLNETTHLFVCKRAIRRYSRLRLGMSSPSSPAISSSSSSESDAESSFDEQVAESWGVVPYDDSLEPLATSEGAACAWDVEMINVRQRVENLARKCNTERDYRQQNFSHPATALLRNRCRCFLPNG